MQQSTGRCSFCWRLAHIIAPITSALYMQTLQEGDCWPASLPFDDEGFLCDTCRDFFLKVSADEVCRLFRRGVLPFTWTIHFAINLHGLPQSAFPAELCIGLSPEHRFGFPVLVSKVEFRRFSCDVDGLNCEAFGCLVSDYSLPKVKCPYGDCQSFSTKAIAACRFAEFDLENFPTGWYNDCAVGDIFPIRVYYGLSGRAHSELFIFVCAVHAKRSVWKIPSSRFMIPPLRPAVYPLWDSRCTFSRFRVIQRKRKGSVKHGFGREWKVYQVDQGIRGISVNLILPHGCTAPGPVVPLDNLVLAKRKEFIQPLIDEQRLSVATVATATTVCDVKCSTCSAPVGEPPRWIVPPFFAFCGDPWEAKRFPYLLDQNGCPYGLDTSATRHFTKVKYRLFLGILLSPRACSSIAIEGEL